MSQTTQAPSLLDLYLDANNRAKAIVRYAIARAIEEHTHDHPVELQAGSVFSTITFTTALGSEMSLRNNQDLALAPTAEEAIKILLYSPHVVPLWGGDRALWYRLPDALMYDRTTMAEKVTAWTYRKNRDVAVIDNPFIESDTLAVNLAIGDQVKGIEGEITSISHSKELNGEKIIEFVLVKFGPRRENFKTYYITDKVTVLREATSTHSAKPPEHVEVSANFVLSLEELRGINRSIGLPGYADARLGHDWLMSVIKEACGALVAPPRE